MKYDVNIKLSKVQLEDVALEWLRQAPLDEVIRNVFYELECRGIEVNEWIDRNPVSSRVKDPFSKVKPFRDSWKDELYES